MKDIAIIGMSCRVPGADCPKSLWNILANGKNPFTSITDKELREQGVPEKDISHPAYVKICACLDGIDQFDAPFFAYSHREAEYMDPQHRLLLEESWKALESSGYATLSSQLNIGVFSSCSINTYLSNNLKQQSPDQDTFEHEKILGNTADFLATRIAYKLNLKGPAMTVQSGCSSSLVALHQARVALLTHQCDIAIVGAVSLSAPKKKGYLYIPDGVASKNGQCRPFDANATGTVFSNGVAVVVLRRLNDAQQDADTIHALLKSSAINNDGSQKGGFTAPSVEGQKLAIAKAYAVAGIDLNTVGLIEAHGTGTPLGDPIEFEALNKAFQLKTQRKQFCALGSLKGNIGHLDTAAGLASLIKAVLCLQHKKIPPLKHYEQPNPKINLKQSPFYINTTLQEWKTKGEHRRIGINALGIGGTNAHAILEEFIQAPPQPSHRPKHIIALSAKSEHALHKMSSNISLFLQENSNIHLPDMAYTFQVGRASWNYRSAFTASTIKEVVEQLQQLSIKQAPNSQRRKLVFLFSGQGAQYINMGLDLYQGENLFRETVDQCCTILLNEYQLNLKPILYPKNEQIKEAQKQLFKTSFTQPALFVIEYALASLLNSWGIKADVYLGHSLGEYVAACLSGVFSLSDALRLVVNRGHLMNKIAPGKMMAVSAKAEKIAAFLPDKVDIAAANSPSSCVISGDSNNLEIAENILQKKGFICRPLQTSHAFHSYTLDPILNDFLSLFENIQLSPPTTPIISNVTGTWLSNKQATCPSYWKQHLRGTVEFSKGICTLQEELSPIFIEMGPGKTLEILTKQHNTFFPCIEAFNTLRHPLEDLNDYSTLLKTLSKLWERGISWNAKAFYQGEKRKRIPLPTYPFDKKLCWISSKKQQANPQNNGQIKNPNNKEWIYAPSWKQSLPIKTSSPHNNAWLIFEGKDPLGKDLSNQLIQKKKNVFRISIGDTYEKISSHNFRINPHFVDDYAKLVSTLCENKHLKYHIVHTWLCDTYDNLSFEQSQNLGHLSILFLIQNFIKCEVQQIEKISVVGKNLIALNKNEIASPYKATALAASKVIPQEYPHIRCQCIDIDSYIQEDLLRELCTKNIEELVIYRRGSRWIQHFEPLHIENEENPKTLVDRGIYIIVGGLGNIGLVYAKYLAKEKNTHIIFVSRSAFPQRALWNDFLKNHHKEDITSLKINQLLEIEKSASSIDFIQGDIISLESMTAVFQKVMQKHGRVDGLFHAAGVKSDQHYQTIPQITLRYFQELFSSKHRGLEVLDEILQIFDIPYCGVLSSISSVLGGLGLYVYSAIHLFIDSFIENKNQKNKRWFAINWEAWNFSHISHKDHELAKGAFGSNLESLTISPDEGRQILSYALSFDQLSRCIVSTSNLTDRYNTWLKQKFFDESNFTPQTFVQRPHLQTVYVKANTETEKKLLNLWQNLLGIEKIGIQDNFFELGGHSLVALKLISQISQSFHKNLSIVDLFEYSTIHDLACYIDRNKKHSLKKNDLQIRSIKQRTIISQYRKNHARRTRI